MSATYYTMVTVHVVAAMLWLGGVFFFVLVGFPVLRKVEPDSLRRELFQSMGERFRIVGWVAVVVLVFTGTANLHLRGLLSAEVLGDAAFWSTPYGRSLAVKLISVTVMLAFSAWHDFMLGPSSIQLEEGSSAAFAARRRAALVARVAGIAGLFVILAAVRLARGG